MDNLTIEAFFEDVATKFVPISHTTQKPRFCRFDLEELATNLREKIDLSNFCLLLETPTGRLLDNGGDGYFDDQHLAFWVIRMVKTNDFAAERDTLSKAREYGRSIVAKCRQELPGAGQLDLSTVEYDKVGPIFKNAYGYRYSFTQPDMAEVRIKADEWHG